MRKITLFLVVMMAGALVAQVYNPYPGKLVPAGGGSGTVTEVQAGTGVTVASGTTTPTVAVDTSVIPTKSTAAGAPTMAGQLTGSIAVDTSASPDRFYFCGADDGTDCTAVIRIGGYAEMLPLAGGTVTGTLTLTGALDASGSSTSKPSKAGTSLPGTCGVGETYIKTDATAANQLYICTSTNTWTAQGGGGTSQFIVNGNAEGTGISTTATRYHILRSISFGATAANGTNGSYVCPVTGTITEFGMMFSSAGTNDVSITLTLVVNTTDSDLAIVLGATHTAGYKTDTGSTACTKGNQLSIKSVNASSGTGTSGSPREWYVLITP